MARPAYQPPSRNNSSKRGSVIRGSMKIQHSSARLLTTALAVALCLPAQMWAQNAGQPGAPSPATQDNAGTTQTPAAPAQPQSATATGQPQSTPQKPPASGTTVNPSQPPLQPATTYPDASGDQPQLPNAPQPATQTQQTTQPQNEPQGAATAERVPSAGGAAAKPAGVAIAPPKQHQARALLLKLGAVAAGAVAAGTIYALSRGTSSTPPGANGPGAVQKK
jgi:cytoskeletal protein RodZ